MGASMLSKVLLVLGALVGAAAGLALALGLRLDQLPPWMITVGMYKLAFIAAGGLLAAGAVLGRAVRDRSRRKTMEHLDSHLVGNSALPDSDPAARDRDLVKRARGD